MPPLLFIVQASSTSWNGGPDLNMNLIDGQPVVFHTVKRIFDHSPRAGVVMAAPEFDRGGKLEGLKEDFAAFDFRIYYGHDASPLLRMVDILENRPGYDYFVRVDGLHCFFDIEKACEMVDHVRRNGLDCMKFPDDFPVQFTSDVFRAKALQRAVRLLEGIPEKAKFHVHPVHFFMHQGTFKAEFLTSLPRYSDEYLRQCRKRAASAYQGPRLVVNEKKVIAAGDQLGFHYELASQYLTSEMRVLDIACGNGFGARKIAGKVREVVGADIDREIVGEAERMSRACRNVSFRVQNAERMDFADGIFDAVLSMETAEHVAIHPFLQEIRRVLKPGGTLVLSTPQNAIGHIPIHVEHQIEYGLRELIDYVLHYFHIDEVFGIKAGRIIIEGSPTGHNTVLVCRNIESSQGKIA